MQYHTAPEVVQAKQSYRYWVELASTQLDADGIVETTRLVDAVVLEPTRTAIAQLIASIPHLQDFEVVSFWQPEDDSPF